MSALACAACGAENPDGARFCMACGAQLERRCPSCGTPAPPAARFCMNCGHGLEGAVVAPAAPAEAPPEERRQVTVLFGDLSGYTAIAERMDPEAVKALVDRALMRLGREVERFGGTVDKYIGDNVMAIFGAPVAHEDDAQRGVRAGLGMQAAMAEVNEGLPPGEHMDLRVGVNTGEVLAGSVGQDYTVIGDTVNVAARLQSAARPGSVTVGKRTMRATRDAVRYEALEPLELKGKAEPVPAWEVLGLTQAQQVGADVAGARVAARGARRRAGGARVPLPACGARVGSPARDAHRRGGRGQVAAPARVRTACRRPAGRARRTNRALPSLRHRHRVLGARRGAPRRVWNRGLGLLGGGLEQALRVRAGALQRRRRRYRRPQGGADRPPARRGRPTRARAGGAGSRAPARIVLLGAAGGHRGDRHAAAARHRVRGHPLGRPRHAGRHRAPRAVGSGAADAGLPGSRRAARPARGLGWRPPLGHPDPSRAPDRPRHAGAGGRADTRGTRGRAGGGGAVGWEPALRRGDGAPDRRGGRPGGAAAGDGAGRARRPSRRPRALRAAARAAGVGGGTHVLGGLPRGARPVRRAAI